jgi:hypothetical protein
MRLRTGILVVALTTVLGSSLTACGGGDGDKKEPTGGSTRLGTPSKSVTETVLDCAKYSETAQKIVAAEQELFAGSGGTSDAFDALKSQLDGLKDGAPASVKAAVDELKTAFEKVEELVKNPDSDAQASLASMGAQLSKDGQTITAYIVSQCR